MLFLLNLLNADTLYVLCYGYICSVCVQKRLCCAMAFPRIDSAKHDRKENSQTNLKRKSELSIRISEAKHKFINEYKGPICGGWDRAPVAAIFCKTKKYCNWIWWWLDLLKEAKHISQAKIMLSIQYEGCDVILFLWINMLYDAGIALADRRPIWLICINMCKYLFCLLLKFCLSFCFESKSCVPYSLTYGSANT